MKFGIWTMVALWACLVRKGQPNTITARDLSSRFFAFAASSAVRQNINALNSTLNGLKNSLNGLTTPAQTEQLQAAEDVLRDLVQQSTDILFKITGALTNLILDETTPMDVRFEQFGSTVREFQDFLDDNAESLISSIENTMGCVRSQQFETVFFDGYSRLMGTADIVSRICKVVLSSNTYDRKPSGNSLQLKNMVDALAQSIKDMNDGAIAYAKVVKSAVNGIETANAFLKILTAKENSAASDTTAVTTSLQSSSITQLNNVRNKYEAAKLAMKTDLTNALKALSIFSSSKQLNRLAEDNRKAYGQFYQFLESRTEEDLGIAHVFYFFLGIISGGIINDASESYIDAVHRTGLRLTDIVLEGGAHAESCYNTFNPKFFAPFLQLSSLVSTCVQRETSRWTSIANAIENLLKLVQMSTQELASNLARCSSAYVNFATSGEDFVKAKACLKMSLDGFDPLFEVLSNQLDNFDEVVLWEVIASYSRLFTCTSIHLKEATAGLKYMRTAIEICAGSYDHCEVDRKNRDNDEKEQLKRRHNFTEVEKYSHCMKKDNKYKLFIRKDIVSMQHDEDTDVMDALFVRADKNITVIDTGIKVLYDSSKDGGKDAGKNGGGSGEDCEACDFFQDSKNRKPLTPFQIKFNNSRNFSLTSIV